MTDPSTTGQISWHANQPVILGIDEAGRGPVLGPMVYTAAYCLKSDENTLNALGVNDSKQLSEEQRERMRLKIDNATFLYTKTHVLPAAELSENMLRRQKYNLNLISHDTAFALLEAVIGEGVSVSEIYVDTVGDPLKYAAKFRERFPSVGKVVVSKKADAIYKIVGAASIVAKTTRDRCIRNWVFAEVERSSRYMDCDHNLPVSFPTETGSGYPSDPVTKNWIEQSCDAIFGFPTLVRFSWGTAKLIMEKKAVQVDWYVVLNLLVYALNVAAVMLGVLKLTRLQLVIFSIAYAPLIVWLFRKYREVDEDEEEGKPTKKPRVKTKDIQSFFTPKSSPVVDRPSKRRRTAQIVCPMPKLLASMSLQRATTLL